MDIRELITNLHTEMAEMYREWEAKETDDTSRLYHARDAAQEEADAEVFNEGVLAGMKALVIEIEKHGKFTGRYQYEDFWWRQFKAALEGTDV